MIKRIIHTFIILSIALIETSVVKAQITEPFKDLEGYWQFSVGDDLKWAAADFNDADWDKIYAPQNWESQGYNEYNGYAWYRKSFKLSSINKNTPVMLYLGKIDDVDQVFINGKLIGQTGDFFPSFVSESNKLRMYHIPEGILKPNQSNVIAVRVYDTYADGGIIGGPLKLYYDITQEMLAIDLSGNWLFAKSEPRNNMNPKLSELNWTQIKVPGFWEDQGFENYDGYGVYLKSFDISNILAEEELVLVLGKIDDYDYVYFNGKLIGKVFNLKEKGAYSGKGNEYQALRGYSIPHHLIKTDEKNTVIVKVYDYFNNGGIYEGPIGIMTQEKFEMISKKYYTNSPTLWDLIFD